LSGPPRPHEKTRAPPRRIKKLPLVALDCTQTYPYKHQNGARARLVARARFIHIYMSPVVRRPAAPKFRRGAISDRYLTSPAGSSTIMPNVHKTADSPIIALERDYNADRDNSDRDHKHRVNNEEVEDPVDAYAVALKMTRVEAFHQVFDSPIKLSAFWAAFVLRAVALAVSTNTTYLYLAFATSYFEGNPLLSTIAVK
jgi:hypothetical protein